MRWLFWKRVEHVMRIISALPRGASCLDFGCGSGAMLPYLTYRYDRVVGCDPDLLVARKVVSQLGLSSVELVEGLEQTNSSEGSRQGFDVIVAMDVLEHVEGLEVIVSLLHDLLRKGGMLVVTGPTENRFYRMGRRLAGFSGDYHVRNVYEVVKALDKEFSVSQVAVLYYPIPLFRVYRAIPV